MRHQVKDIKFKVGYDANRMLLKKLVKNFLNNGYIVTTIKRARILKSHLDKLITKTKEKTEANKNYLLKYLGDLKLVNKLFDLIGSQLKDISSGYVKILKLNFRDNDGSLLAKIVWSKPVIYKENKNQEIKENLKKNSKKIVKSKKVNKK